MTKKPISFNDYKVRAFFTLAVFFVPVVFLYQGIFGPFILDDASNLDSLGQLKQLDLDSLANWISSGVTGSDFGRHATFLTFAFQYNSWPDNPDDFKFGNLFIHSVNTVLLYLLLNTLGRFEKSFLSSKLAVFLLVAVWSIHPILHSSIFYVVQRLVLLSSTWVLLVLLVYCRCISAAAFDTPRSSFFWMGFVFGGATFGVLFKEITSLIPLYILALELFVVKTGGRYRRFALAAFFAAPMIIIAAITFWAWNGGSEVAEIRGLTFANRVFSEFSVITQYVGVIVFPSISNTGLIADDVIVAKYDQVGPWLAVVVWLSLVFLCLRARSKFSLLKMGILWFLLGHSLESTGIPLELYFEHRNYLPSVGILLCFFGIYQYAHKFKVYTQVALSILTINLIWCSWINKDLWASEQNLLSAWYVASPDSHRATQYWADYLVRNQNFVSAMEVYEEFHREHPDNIHMGVVKLTLQCYLKTDQKQDFDALLQSAENARITTAINRVLTELNRIVRDAGCKEVSRADVEAIARKFLDNRLVTNRILIADIYYVIADVALSQNRIDEAVELLNLSYDHYPMVEVQTFQAKILLATRQFDEAAKSLDKAIALHDKLGGRDQNTYQMHAWLKNKIDSRQGIPMPSGGK